MPGIDSGEAAAPDFDALLAGVLDPAFGVAVRLTRNRDEAEDLMQDAAIQAFRALHTFREGTNFKAWFFSILINRFRRGRRDWSRGPQVTCLDDAPDLYLYS